jgi:hypothetical protein
VGDPLAVRWAKTRATASKTFCVDGYRVAKKAYVTTSYSAILVLENQRVYLHGAGKPRTDSARGKSGAIDGNRAGQSLTSPLMCTRPMEDLRANCGISVVDSSWVKVEGLYLHDANLHNIAVYNSHDCEVAGLDAARSNDKNICVIEVKKVRLINNYCHDSQVEDGICCHGPVGPYMLIARNRTTGNPRYGIHVGIKNDYAIVARNVSLSNRIDLGVVGVPPFTHWKGVKQEDKGLILIENPVSEKKNP